MRHFLRRWPRGHERQAGGRLSGADPGIEEHIPALRRYARRLVRDADAAEDLVQDTLERALHKLHLWQPGNLRGWLMTLMHNVRVNQVQRPASVLYVEVLDDHPARTCESAVIDLLDVERAVARLPAEQQVVLAMAALGELSIEEIAEALGIPVGTVLSRVSRGRSRLRMLVDRE